MKSFGALSVVLVALQALAGRGAVAADITRDVPFTDGYGYDAMQKLVDMGVVTGYPDETFGGERAMTRYEFVGAWARLVDKLGFSQPEFSLGDVVTDVPEGHWARPSVERLAGLKLLPVLPLSDIDSLHWAAFSVVRLDELFVDEAGPHVLLRGERPLLRGEYADMVYRTLRVGADHKLGPGVPPELVAETPGEVALKLGVLCGYPDERLHLERAMTRSDFAIATARLVDKWKSEERE